MTTLAIPLTTSHATRRAAMFWLLVALCLFSALLGRLGYILRPFDSDGAMFIYMGRLITEGGRFGHDFCDNKFPTVGLMTSVPWRLFGPSWPQYVLLETAMSLIMASLLARMAGRHFGEHAVVPTLLYAIVHLNVTFVVFGGFQLETIQAFFEVLAAGAALEFLDSSEWRDAITAGMAVGCAMMLKPTGISVAVAAMIALLPAWRRQMRLAVGMLLGVAMPAAVVITYLIRADNLRDMPAIAGQIADYTAHSFRSNWDWVKPATVLMLGGFPLLVRGFIFRRPKDQLAIKTNRTALLLVLLWLALETAGVIAQRRMYAYHFMVMGPPMALLFGLLPRRERLVPLAAALIPMCLFSIYGTGVLLRYGYDGRDRLEVSDDLLVHASPADAVWMDDAARLWLETGMRPGSRYPLTFLFANDDTAPLRFGRQIILDFQSRLPKYVILRADFEPFLAHQGRAISELNEFPVRRENFNIAWRNIRAYVLANYVKAARVGNNEVYRRREE